MKTLIQLIFASYFFQGFQIFAIGTFGVSATEILLLIFYCLLVKKTVWDGVELNITPTPAFIFFIILIVSALLSGLTPLFDPMNDKLIQYFKTTSHFLFKVAFTLACFVYPIKKEVWSGAIRTWLYFSIVINFFAVYQIIARAYDLPLAWIQFTNVSYTLRGEAGSIEDIEQLSLRFENFFRATSIFSEPSALAQFNLYILAFLIIPFIHTLKPLVSSKILNILMFVGSLLAIFLAFSLTGALGAFVMLLGIVFIERKRILKQLSVFIVISLSLLIITDTIISNYVDISVLSLFSQRIESVITGDKSYYIEGESFDTRTESASKGLIIWKEHPIIGCGLGLTQYQRSVNMIFSDFSIMTVLAEMGIIGFIAFTGLFVALFILAFKTIKDHSEDSSAEEKTLLHISLYIVIFQIMFNFITSNILVNTHLWMPLGMVISIIMNVKSKNSAPSFIFKILNVPLKNYFRKII